MSDFADGRSGMAEVVRQYLRRDYGVVLSDEEVGDVVERLLLETDPEAVIEVSGRDIMTGLRRIVEIGRGDFWPPDALMLAPRR